MKLINIGFGNMVSASRLVAIVSPESAPIKRIIAEAKEKGTLIDATHGRRTRAVIITDSDLIILTYLQSETVANRLNDYDDGSSRNGGLCDFQKTEGNQWSLSSGGFSGETQRYWQSRFPCSKFFYVLIFLTAACAGQYQHQGHRQMQS